MLQEAVRLEPDAYQPHLFASAMSEQPGTELERCLAKNPRSLQALLLFADHLASEGQIERAVASLLAAAEIYPSYDLPYLRVAQLLERCGDRAQAQGFFEIASQLRGPFSALAK
jgi:tetratricopeptide (TPR) repeat protein